MPVQRLILFLLLFVVVPASAQVTVTRGQNLSVDAARDGRLAIDLLGELWVVPGGGGDARQLTQNIVSAQRPRWSPDARQLTYQATVNSQRGIWIYDFKSDESRSISENSFLDIHPVWHPGGERITYTSGRSGAGFDLWEVDVATGLHWRISDQDGDETEPAWSADGRDLVYVHKHEQSWSLVLRKHGQNEEVLVSSTSRLAAPSFRPDGSLISFVSTGNNENRDARIDMVVLSKPRLIRPLLQNEQFVASPVTWLDRHKMVYSANGALRQRDFNSWTARLLPFRATIAQEPSANDGRERPALTWPDQPDGEYIIHAARMFDGLGNDYAFDRDIAIRGGHIANVTPHQDHHDGIVIDMGDLAILPGFIDADARLPGTVRARHGPDLLTTGVTTVVGQHADGGTLNTLWSGKVVPGPRLLNAAEWRLGNTPRPEIDVTAAVIGSRATGQTAGAALATQFRRLGIAGLTPAQTLRAVGVNAAAALLADPYLGRIANGASADLVFVDGDPLHDIDDALNVVAVVRNGRFYSVSGLRDRARAAESVE